MDVLGKYLRLIALGAVLIAVAAAYGKGRMDQAATCRADELSKEVASLKAVIKTNQDAKAKAEAEAIALNALAQDLAAKVTAYEVSLIHPVPLPSKSAGAGDQLKSAPAPPAGCALGDDAARRLRDIR